MIDLRLITRGITLLGNRALLFYPLIVATYPVIFFLAENPREAITAGEVMALLAVVWAGTFLLTLLIKLLVNDNAKATAIAFILLVAFFAYGMVHVFLVDKVDISVANVVVGEHSHLVPVSLALTLAGILLVITYSGPLVRILEITTIIALALVLFNVGRVAQDYWSGSDVDLTLIQSLNATPSSLPDPLPDIYYIVLDSYGRADKLQEYLGFDNSGFVDALKAKGFFVADKSRSNYNYTSWSLSSTLNMRYLDGRDEDFEQLLQENAVVQFLKDLGYQYVHFGSGWSLTKNNRHADVKFLGDNDSLPIIVNEFSSHLMDRTILSPIADALGVDLVPHFTSIQVERFQYNLRHLRDVPAMSSPTFAFNHNIPPHSPFVFDRRGSLKAQGKEEFPDDDLHYSAAAYLEQVLYVNESIQSVVDDILMQSAVEPIIIVQGDHGPQRLGRYIVDSNYPTDLRIDEHTAILNAYYLPEYCQSGLYSTITPMNTFRLIFDDCFGTEFGPLADESYLSPDEPLPIDFSLLQR